MAQDYFVLSNTILRTWNANGIDIAAIIQGYAQGYFLMADEDGDNLGWYSSLESHT